MPRLERDGEVFVLHLGDGENRFNPEFVDAVNALLDDVEAAPEPRALVTAAGGKIWSNGLDLDWMGQHVEEIGPFVTRVHRLLARFLALPVPSVAALTGHTFAAGAMLALAHDSRVMRADRGFFCLPEVDIRIPFTPGMASLLQSRLTAATAHDAMTTGRRYGGIDAMDAGIVQAAVPEHDVVPDAVARAQALAGKHGPTLGAIKEQMYAPALGLLRSDAAPGLSIPS